MTSITSSSDGVIISNDTDDRVFIPVADYIVVISWLVNRIKEQGLYKPL